MVHLGEVSPQVWDTAIEFLQSKIEGFQSDDLVFNWRKSANMRKFDRELFAKYGYFKDIILHPQFQMIKHYLFENVDLNLNIFLGEPMIPASTTVIVLFMLYKRVSVGVLVLALSFVFNLNPLYVSVLVMSYCLTLLSKVKPLKYQHINSTLADTNTQNAPIAVPHTWSRTQFDHILIGNDIGTLYTAALLSRNGHKCCVLQPEDGSVQQVFPVGAPCAVPLTDLSVGRVEHYQNLLDAAAVPGGDRVRFAPMGTAQDGHTSAVVEIYAHSAALQVEDEGTTRQVLPSQSDRSRRVAVALRAGDTSLSTDMSALLQVERASFQHYLLALSASLQVLPAFLLSRVSSPALWLQSELVKSPETKSLSQLAASSIQQVVYKCDRDADACEMFSYLHGIGAVGAQEGLSSGDLSALCLGAAITDAASGVFYPVGGWQAVQTALCRSISGAGGVVHCGADVQELVLEEVAGGGPAVRVSGVRVASRADSRADGTALHARLSVVSGMGALCTYTKLLPPEALSAQTKLMLSTLREATPRVKVVFWLSGGSADLGLCSADYYEVDRVSSAASSSFVKVWSPSTKDESWIQRHGPDLQVVVVELDSEDSLVQHKQFLFESPPSDEANEHSAGGPVLCYSRHAGDERTDPAHEEFSCELGHSVTASRTTRDRLAQQARAHMLYAYPHCAEREVFVWVELPRLGGHSLSNTTAKYSASLSATTDVQNLFLTGKDLATVGLAGEIQGGWVAANAVLGYSLAQLSAGQRNIVADLQNIRA